MYPEVSLACCHSTTYWIVKIKEALGVEMYSEPAGPFYIPKSFLQSAKFGVCCSG